MAADGTMYENGAYKFEAETQMIQVVFKARNHRFLVHRKLLTDNSPHIQDIALNSDEFFPPASNSITVFLEGTANEGAYFNYFVNWLYSGVIKTKTKADITDEEAKKGDPEYFTLAKSYLIGRLMKSGKYCEAVLDIMQVRIKANRRSFFDNRYLADIVCILYELKERNGKVKKWLADVFTEYAEKRDVEGLRGKVPEDFLTDVLLAFMENRDWECSMAETIRETRLTTPACDGPANKKRRHAQMDG